MNNLIERIRKNRQKEINVEGFVFIIKRPDYFLRSRYDFSIQENVLRQCVIGWVGIKEMDLIPGGTGVEVDFSIGLFMEWIADKPAFWQPLVDAIYDAYTEYRDKLDDEEKKLVPG